MPRGLARIQQLAKEANERSAAYEAGDGGGVRALKLRPGETATGRFCEEGNGVWFLYMHELPKKPGQKYGDRVLCLDQDEAGVKCRGCELENVKRTARVVVNFLRYDEPKLVRDANGKAVKNGENYVFDGTEPTVVLWEASQTVGGRIAYLEMDKSGGDPDHGITNHVIKIRRAGQKEWDVDVIAQDLAPDHPDAIAMAQADGPFERSLFNAKIDPPQAITNVFPRYMSRPLMTYAQMTHAFGGVAVPSGFQSDGAPGLEDNTYAKAARDGLNLGPLGAFGG